VCRCIITRGRGTTLHWQCLGHRGLSREIRSGSGELQRLHAFDLCHRAGGNCEDGGGSFPSNDPNTAVMRWGNYDTLSVVNRFVSSEVPSAISKYANVCALQPGFARIFLSFSETFLVGSMPWPAIGQTLPGRCYGRRTECRCRSQWPCLPYSSKKMF